MPDRTQPDNRDMGLRPGKPECVACDEYAMDLEYGRIVRRDWERDIYHEIDREDAKRA